MGAVVDLLKAFGGRIVSGLLSPFFWAALLGPVGLYLQQSSSIEPEKLVTAIGAGLWAGLMLIIRAPADKPVS